MKEQFEIKTNNPIVDRIGKMNITGNIIPEAWYHTIVSANNKPNTHAILILSEIVYWYRPTEEREENGNAVRYVKKFKDKDYVQKSYDQLRDKFNLSQKQIRECLKLLESLGVIKRHFRNIDTKMGKLTNVMFIELIPDALERLTFPESNDDSQDENTSFPNSDTLLPKKETPLSQDATTYTNTISENKTKSTTTASKGAVVTIDNIKAAFKGIDLPDKDILAVYNASNKDLDKCKAAVELALNQTTEIKKLTGWLISAVEKGYSAINLKPSGNKNKFNNFLQNKVNYDELESLLLDN